MSSWHHASFPIRGYRAGTFLLKSLQNSTTFFLFASVSIHGAFFVQEFPRLGVQRVWASHIHESSRLTASDVPPPAVLPRSARLLSLLSFKLPRACGRQRSLLQSCCQKGMAGSHEGRTSGMDWSSQSQYPMHHLSSIAEHYSALQICLTTPI